MSTQNKAAWFDGPNKPFRVADAPYTKAGSGEVVIRNEALGINHIDFLVQGAMGGWIQTIPNIVGEDIAGVIHEIGEGVAIFKPGDRVLAHSVQLYLQQPQYGGFQLYSVVPTYAVSKIPDSLASQEAAVIPLGFDTSIAALFSQTFLDLELPKNGQVNPGNLSKVVFIPGGASAVGAAGIQLAHRAGYAVVTTASKANHDAVRRLGAQSVVDYKAEDVAAQVEVEIRKLGTLVGIYDAISSEDSTTLINSVADRIDPSIIIALVRPPTPRVLAGKNAKQVSALHPYFDNEEGAWGFLPAVQEDGRLGRYFMGDGWLYRALEAGEYVSYPPPKVIGGLESAQKGVEFLHEGVSAQKLVITP